VLHSGSLMSRLASWQCESKTNNPDTYTYYIICIVTVTQWKDRLIACLILNSDFFKQVVLLTFWPPKRLQFQVFESIWLGTVYRLRFKAYCFLRDIKINIHVFKTELKFCCILQDRLIWTTAKSRVNFSFYIKDRTETLSCWLSVSSGEELFWVTFNLIFLRLRVCRVHFWNFYESSTYINLCR